MLSKIIMKWGIVAILFFTMSNGFISIPPSEIVLSIAGALTVNNNLYLVGMLFGVIMANYLGTLILYYISLRKGKEWYDKIQGKIKSCKITFIGKLIPTSDSLICFFNNQEWLIFSCRFIPFIRSVISVPAGISRMNFFKFTIYSIAGITIWSFTWIWVGRTMITGIMKGNIYIILALAILFIISGVIGNFVRKRINKYIH